MSRRALALSAVFLLAGCPGSPPAAPAASPPPTASPSPTPSPSSAWQGWGPGSVLETETATDTTDPTTHTRTLVRRTVLGRDARAASLRVEIFGRAAEATDWLPVRTYETTVSLADPPAPSGPRETVAVAAGTFSCWRLHRSEGDVARDEWFAEGVPFPVRAREEGKSRSATTQLSRIEKKSSP